jgi:hypothetical protein
MAYFKRALKEWPSTHLSTSFTRGNRAMTKSTNLHPAQLAALSTYAATVGRKWKWELSMDWSRACSSHVSNEIYGTLHTIRNQYGPSWLENFKFPGVEGD